MRSNWVLLLALATLSLTANAQQCGQERWKTKTLQDAAASEIHFTPEPSTVHFLREPKAPVNLRKVAADFRYPGEKQVYSVQALLIGYKKESDSDYHLVLADPVDRAKTMIAEIPAPGCANPKYSAQFIAAAKLIESLGHASPKFRKLAKPVKVTVTGVFFFDFIHGQTGVAPNGAELHPVLSIKQ